MSSSTQPRRIIYPGTFDPITHGHEDLVRRAALLFDEVVVAIAAETPKNPIFSLADRVALARETLTGIPGVRVRAFSGLLIHLLEEEKTHLILRGLRAISDFEHEFQLASINRRMDAQIETLFLMTSDQHTFLSSSLVREISRLGGDVSAFVQPAVARALKQQFSDRVDHRPSGK
ncbi:pantetheine-phosphate adenylyltransferase [Acidithiobacillus montserratensis]|uniref:Pantetheine-phosphate adenylyltransferase n=1 Tax=Acidithiobacillus montserratensis TaxID=2729135 RepID=A0ACD5HG65_9PROT|nr:pantetheine-phosphate adenylyltransferase [Acidithiobacillus montserratensis]MBN2679142.1 pantetheine-phosphate adenylyltransferase [Acidithiobacillaceae bacterium]MBU2747138.1 pantetheine-phosphate adenylyltransferase [Acidithiobacillus montserratensis]